MNRIWLLLAILSAPLAAQAEPQSLSPTAQVPQLAFDNKASFNANARTLNLLLEGQYPKLLSGFRPSFFGFAYTDEELRAQFLVSVKYPFSGKLDTPEARDHSGPYFEYTGKYDFFMTTRQSSPVVSRLQNVGAFWKQAFPLEQGAFIDTMSAGYIHESNGQVIDTKAKYDQAVKDDAHAVDQISRGNDYLWFSVKNETYLGSSPFIPATKMVSFIEPRYYLPWQGFNFFGNNSEEDDFWRDSPIHPHRNDYDGMRYICDFRNPIFHLTLQARHGISGLEGLGHVSYEIACTSRLFRIIPLTAYYFRGYGKDINLYQDYGYEAGLGLELW